LADPFTASQSHSLIARTSPPIREWVVCPWQPLYSLRNLALHALDLNSLSVFWLDNTDAGETSGRVLAILAVFELHRCHVCSTGILRSNASAESGQVSAAVRD